MTLSSVNSLSSAAFQLLSFVSQAGIGKLSLQKDYESVESGLEIAGITLLPISFADTVQVCKLPLHHRDPFDRLLIAQATNLSLAIVSRDIAFDAYSIHRIWT